MNTKSSNKPIGILGICMFSIIAVDSIRALPINAAYGLSLVGILVLGGLLFLLPCAFVSAELASTWPEDGGLYVWVREAFGTRVGFIANWLLWVYNMVWFPTIIAFICATVGSAIFPNYMQHKVLLLTAMLGLFWLVTAINCLGVRGSSLLSSLGTVVGTLTPIIIIIALTADWIWSGQKLAIPVSLSGMLPQFSFSNIGLLPSMVFGLVGIEVSASFAGQVKNPRRNFPIAMLLSTVVILASLILGSLAIILLVPAAKLNLATGVIQSFQILFNHLGMPYMTNWVILFIFLGSIGGMSTWMAGPSRNMMIAAQDGVAPKFIKKTNRFNAPTNMLICQGIIFSVLCSAYLLFPKFNSAYELLSNMTGQLSILVYLFIFAAVIHLRYSQKNKTRPFQLPGGNLGLWLVAGIAWITCLLVFAVGFIPPTTLGIMRVGLYEGLMVGMIIITLLCGALLAYRKT